MGAIRILTRAQRSTRLCAWISFGVFLLTARAATGASFFQVDLSHHVTHSLYEGMLKGPGNNLANLAGGAPGDQAPRKTMLEIPFRLDGLILVGPGESSNGRTGEPVEVVKKVEAIPVGRKADRLYFLHATNFHATDGDKLAAYVVHYADGTKEEIPVRYGEDIRDWWNFGSDKDAGVSKGQIAWTGNCEASSRDGIDTRLFMKTWKNPHPEREIRTLDMVSGDQPSGQGAPAPFLVAVTGAIGEVEKNGKK